MKTTIITLAFKHERYIRESLQSAIGQTRPADEIIVVDDASPDATGQIAEAFIRENPAFPIRLLRNEKNLGVSASFARAVAAASGDIIFGLAGDDVASPHRLEKCLEYLSDRPATFALITNAEIIDETSARSGRLDNCAGRDVPVSLSLGDLAPGEHFLRGRSSCGATAAYRAAVFREFSPMRAGLYAEDDPAAFRAMLLGSCDFLPLSLVRWRKHANNLSHGTGARRGPEMALHFRKCEAMIDQMLADADEWVSRNPRSIDEGFGNALADLRFQKARWALWAVAHEKGVRIAAFMCCLRAMNRHSFSMRAFITGAWRPLLKMFTPYFAQRLFVRIRLQR